MYYTLISQNHSVVIYGKCLFWIFNRIYNVIHYNCDVDVHLVPAGCSSWSMSWDPAPVSPVWSWSVGVHKYKYMKTRIVTQHICYDWKFTIFYRWSNFQQTFWFLSFLIGQKKIHDFWESLHLGNVPICFALGCFVFDWKKAGANYSKILLRE